MLNTRKLVEFSIVNVVFAATVACAAEPTEPEANGGTGNGPSGGTGGSGVSGNGGTSGSGGTLGGTGGSGGNSGGTAGSGTGGSAAGMSGSGGAGATSGAGGSSAGLGGGAGMPQGGSPAGGASGATGAAAGSGGSAAGQGGASGSGGSGGSAGLPSGDPDPSAGCGKAPMGVCDQQNAPCTANGLNYYIDMPEDYDQTRPYPVVFQYHPLGGTGQGARTMYRVRPAFPDAIYVSPDGSDNGFPNQGGEDEEVTRAIMETIEANLCVDRARYFATGFSYGGSMSYTAMCNMSDKFRAVAGMAGAPISGARCANTPPERPVAVLGIHGEEDTALPITMAEPIIEAMIEKNGCTNTTMPSDLLNSICETAESALATGEYQGCMEGYPVVWCPMPGRPHEIPQWSGESIARFFMQF
jgi:poly(3-hydroxybutyrate) depolymerase